MALLNKLFSSKKKVPKQGYVHQNKNESNWRPFNFSKHQVRILLFRECDWRGRKLLFDSNAVQKVTLESPTTTKFRLGNKIKENNKTGSFVEVTNDYGYQFIKPDSDISMIGEMVFGAVAMTFRGNSLKVHSISSPNRVMCTKVFPSPIARNSRRKISNKSLEDSTGSSINSMSDYGSEIKFASGSGPLDVPSPNANCSIDSGIHVDCFFSHSCKSTCYCFSPRSSDSRSNSFSSSSGSSLASLHRRFHRSLTTSLDFTGYYSCAGWTEENNKKSAKRAKLGLAIIIGLDEVQEKEMSVFFFEHMPMIESMVERLKTCVEQAYIHSETFVHFMMEGTDNLKQWIWDLFCAPRLTTPIWHGLTINKTINNNLPITFLQDFCQLLALIDTKATNFFISTLVTAVLTHHLGWVNTILQNKNKKADSSGKMFNDFSKSHPYNPLWAQLGDLYGALGTPLKIARTVITASGPKKNDLVNKILNTLTYFIRSGIVEKKIINCEQNLESQEKDEVDDSGFLNFKEIEEKEEILSRLERGHCLDRRAPTSALTDEQKRYNIKLQILEREMNNLKSRKTFHCEVINGNLGSPSGAEWENESDYPLPVTPLKSDSQSTFKQTSENQEINASCSYTPSAPENHTFHTKRSETFNDQFVNNSKKSQFGLKSSRTCFDLSSLNSNSDLNALNKHQNSIEQVESKDFNPKVKSCSINSNGENNLIKSLNINKTQFSDVKETSGILTSQEHKSPSNTKKIIFVLGEDEKLLSLKNENSPETIGKNNNKNITMNTTLIELTQHVSCKIVGRSQSFNLPAKRQTLDLFRRFSDSDRKLDSMRTSSKLSLQTNFYKTYETKDDKLISGHAMFEDYSTLSDEDAQEVKKEENVEVEKEETSQKINKTILSFEDLDIKELPLPSLLLQEIDSYFYGYPQTLFGGICDHYTSDLVIHGCNDLDPGWESSLRRDLILSTQHSVLDQQISEAVCIVANIESWEVQLVSSQTYLVDRPNSLGIRVGMSQLVANMLESLLYLWKLKFTPEHCLMHLESKLGELYLKSEALAEMLLSTEFCNMDLLTSSLDLEANDVPLLLAVASIHTPELAQKYGVTFR